MRRLGIIAVLLLAVTASAADCRRGLQQANRIISGAVPWVYGDFDEDGRMDIAATPAVMLNRGGSVFEPREIAGASWFPAVTEDLNHDGHLDLIYHPTGAFEAAYGNGFGSFTRPAHVFTDAAGPAEITDANGDGLADFVEEYDAIVYIRTLEGPLNVRELARLQPATNAFGRPITFAVGDYDGDGRVDVMIATVADPILRKWVVSIYWQEPGFTFVPRTYGAVALNVFKSIDVDSDGAVDLVDAESGQLSVLRFPGREMRPSTIGVPNLRYSTVLRMFDIDHDGYADLLFRDGIAWGTGPGTFGPARSWEGVSAIAGLVDLDGNGVEDIVWNNNEGITFVPLERGQRDFAMPPASPLDLQAIGSAVADLDGDGNLDVIAHDAREVVLAFGDGHGHFLVGARRRFSDSVNVVPADFDGDGKADLAVSVGDQSQILFGEGRRDFGTASLVLGTAAVAAAVRVEPASPPRLVATTNGDLVAFSISSSRTASMEKIATIGPQGWASGTSTGDVRVQIGYTYTVYTPAAHGGWTAIPLPSEHYIVADLDHQGKKLVPADGDVRLTADVDHDGLDDVIGLTQNVSHSHDTVYIRRNAGGGSLESLTTAVAGDGLLADAFAFDADGDGWTDVVLIDGHGVIVLRNICEETRIRVAMVPAQATAGQSATFFAYAVSTDSFAIGAIQIFENGKLIGFGQPLHANEYGTLIWSSPPLTAGRHTYTFRYNDQYAASWEKAVTFDVSQPAPRRHAAPH